MKIKLKRNESFYIREGWFEKAINCIADNEGVNIFYKNDGISYLGIGSNMVKSLKYWLKAANIIEGKDNNLTDFGKLLHQYDRYLDSKFSWNMIHLFIASNKKECPITYTLFNYGNSTMEKAAMKDLLMKNFLQIDKTVNEKFVEADLNVFLNSYVQDTVIDNPEDNYSCPLSSLKLLKKKKNKYSFTAPAYHTLSYEPVYYLLYQVTDGKPFDIEESMKQVNSPYAIFNLDQYAYMAYLDDMRRQGLITINKTAGLNAVYFDEQYKDADELLKKVFEVHFNDGLR